MLSFQHTSASSSGLDIKPVDATDLQSQYITYIHQLHVHVIPQPYHIAVHYPCQTGSTKLKKWI